MILNMSTSCPDDVAWGADFAQLEGEWLAEPDEGEEPPLRHDDHIWRWHATGGWVPCNCGILQACECPGGDCIPF
jgi:hypothetical protein